MEHFFPRNSGGDLRSDAHQNQIIGGDADVDHTQIIGGDTVKLLGEYIPPGFRHPWQVRYNERFDLKNMITDRKVQNSILQSLFFR